MRYSFVIARSGSDDAISVGAVLCEIATPSARNDEPNYMTQLAFLN